MQTQMTIILEGDIYPYTRTTKQQKFADLKYKLYSASQQAIGLQASAAMAGFDWSMFPLGQPLQLGIILQMKAGLHKRDQSNQTKAIEDALQHVAMANDAWIDRTYVERFLGPEDRCLVVIGVFDPGDPARWIAALRDCAFNALKFGNAES